MRLERTTEDPIRNNQEDAAWSEALSLVRRVWDKERDTIVELQKVFKPVHDLWRDVKGRALNDPFRYGFLYCRLASQMEHLVRERVYDRASKVIGYHFRPTRCWREGDLVSVVAEIKDHDEFVVFTYYHPNGNRRSLFENSNQVRTEFVKFLAARLSRRY